MLEQPFRAETLIDLLSRRAQQTPDRVIYRFLPDGVPDQAEEITYAALQERAQAIAVLLHDLGCLHQPVLLLYPAGLDYIAAFLGCLYAGAIAVPASPPRPNRSLDRIESMVQDAGATLALTDGATLAKLERRLGDSPALRSLYCLSTDGLETRLAQQWQPPAVTTDSLALLQYTSGSTAAPKGVMISHGNLLHNSELISRCFGNTPESRGVSWLPPYHDMGLVGGILQPLYVGAEMTLMAPVSFLQRPLRWLEAIAHYRATTSGGPNFAYDLCLRKTTPEQRQGLDLSGWELAFTGAEPIHQETLTEFATAFAPSGFRSQAFYPCYGMAETTLMVTGATQKADPKHLVVQASALQRNQVIPVAPAHPEAARPIVSCGHPAIANQVCIVDPESHRPCPPQVIGEIWVRQSPSIAQGYWRRQAETVYSFHATLADGNGETFLRTGDLGFLHEGNLYVTGRLKDLIIIRGRNHYPQDIEATVEQAHPALSKGSCAAFSVILGNTEQLVVVQELERSALRSVDAEAVFAAIRRQVAEQHDLQIGAIGLLRPNAMPKTSSGKIQRHRCRTGFLDGQLDFVYSWQADDPSPALEIWESISAASATETATPPTLAARESTVQVMTEVKVLPRPVPTLTTPKAIQTWMVDWLAKTLKVPTTSLDVRQPLAEYGLDSITAVELAEALESTLGVPLSPTLAYEYPTIEALAAYLAAAQAPAQAPRVERSARSREDTEVEQLVQELTRLPEAEIQALLDTPSIDWS
ncbi:MAG TPA: AMP-binding protein [Leptolyngbyaceae cyanobacterium M65_K2018_010]|nr:AMP-binding protein [Leptolyngbyaceae cyanobacterium M65_K2018_010]